MFCGHRESFVRGREGPWVGLRRCWFSSALPLQREAARLSRYLSPHGTPREQATKAQLEQVLGSYDLGKYTFTRRAVIEEGARNHAFPVLTLNARFADSADELLASYVHEQLHWHLRDLDHSAAARGGGIGANVSRRTRGSARRGRDPLYSTYGHLVTSYLELQAIRSLVGVERAAAVIHSKPHYLWIYGTVLSDEEKIGHVVRAHGLEVR